VRDQLLDHDQTTMDSRTAIRTLPSAGSKESITPVTDLNGKFVGLVHIREAVRATAGGADPTVRQLMTTPLTLAVDMPVAQAVTTMRSNRAQLALVAETDDHIVGIAALEDLLEELIGDFDDETDTPTSTTPRRRPGARG